MQRLHIFSLSFCLMACQLTSCNLSDSDYASNNFFDSGLSIYPNRTYIEHNFRSRNPLSVPLKIIRLNTSCSCTGSTVNKERVAPGEEFRVTMKIRLPNVSASDRVSCELVTDPPLTSSQSSFMVKYRTMPEVGLSTDFVDFGVVLAKHDAKAKPVHHIDVDSACGVDILPIGVISMSIPEELNVTKEANAPKAPLSLSGSLALHRQRYFLTLNDCALTLAGSQVRTVIFVLSNGVSLPLKVRWTSAGHCFVTPSSLHFGFIDHANQSYTKRLTVEYNHASVARIQNVKITGVDSKQVTIHTQILRQSESVDTIAVSLKFASLPEKKFLQGDLELLQSTDPVERTVVPWSAFKREDRP